MASWRAAGRSAGLAEWSFASASASLPSSLLTAPSKVLIIFSTLASTCGGSPANPLRMAALRRSTLASMLGSDFLGHDQTDGFGVADDKLIGKTFGTLESLERGHELVLISSLFLFLFFFLLLVFSVCLGLFLLGGRGLGGQKLGLGN